MPPENLKSRWARLLGALASMFLAYYRWGLGDLLAPSCRVIFSTRTKPLARVYQMQFIKIFGTNYYLITETCPTWVQHALRLITDRWGFDLDTEQSTGVPQVPAPVRHRANTLLSRWGAQNA